MDASFEASVSLESANARQERSNQRYRGKATGTSLKTFNLKDVRDRPDTHKKLLDKLYQGLPLHPTDISADHFKTGDKLACLDFFGTYPEVKLHLFGILFPGSFRRTVKEGVLTQNKGLALYLEGKDYKSAR